VFPIVVNSPSGGEIKLRAGLGGSFDHHVIVLRRLQGTEKKRTCKEEVE